MQLRRRRRLASRPLRLEPLESRQLLAFDSLPDFSIDVQETNSFRNFAELESFLARAHALSGVQSVRTTYGLDGRGQTVVVIDSGVAWDHQALGVGFGPGYKIVGGWDFAENDANPYDDAPAGFHGTHVTGIIASNDTTYVGVAPGVDIVALRVFDDRGAGYFSWVESALRWVYEHRSSFRFPITTVNMSLGTEWNGTSVPSWSTIEDELAQLKLANIVVTVAAGNSFAQYRTPGLSYPASSPYVIPVMSVSGDGTLSSFSQRHSRAIGAPGERITSTVPDYVFGADGVANDFGTASGTSMAAPYLAGVTTLVRQAMQFVDYVGITPDAIYQHLRNTADTVFDPVTNNVYLRVNAQRAIDTLMPADDYGSVPESAHDLGVLSGSRSVAGAIHRLDDVDYFSFVAAATGTVRLEVTASNWLVPQVQLHGGSWSDNSVQEFSVTAGQRYTFAIRTAGGIGHYDLRLTGPGGTVVADWGTVSQSTRTDLPVDGQTWYRATATQDGWFTVEGWTGSGELAIEVRSASGELLRRSASSSASRVDVQVRAGQVLLVGLSGTATRADVRLTNLLQQAGGELRVFGTENSDNIGVQLGTTYSVWINDTLYTVAADQAARITIDGRGGADSLRLLGASSRETVTLRPGSASVTAGRFILSAVGFTEINAVSGGGGDVVTLYDSSGDDSLTGHSEQVTLSGSGYRLSASGFAAVTVIASQGLDTATLEDSPGNDTFTATVNEARLQGPGFGMSLKNFDRVGIVCTRGGADTAYLYDSPGNDQFTARGEAAVFQGATFSYEVQRFSRVVALAVRGFDRASLYGSDGDDLYQVTGNVGRLVGPTYDVTVQGFDVVDVAGLAGTDRAELVGTRGNDYLRASPQEVLFVSGGGVHQLHGFERLRADGGGGRDSAVLYGSQHDDQFQATPGSAWLAGPGYRIDLLRFGQITVDGAGGEDSAQLYGAGRGDRFSQSAGTVVLSGTNYRHTLMRFSQVTAYSSPSGRLLGSVQAGSTGTQNAASPAPRSAASVWHGVVSLLSGTALAGGGSRATHLATTGTAAPQDGQIGDGTGTSSRDSHYRLFAAWQQSGAANQLASARRVVFSLPAVDAYFAEQAP